MLMQIHNKIIPKNAENKHFPTLLKNVVSKFDADSDSQYIMNI